MVLEDIEQERRAHDKLHHTLDVLEDCLEDMLVAVLGTACKHNNHPDPRAAGEFIHRTLKLPADTGATPPDGLSEREADVLNLIAWGRSHKEIGTRLGISVKTVEFHRAAALAKLGLYSRTDIVRYALSQCWLAKDADPEHRT